MTDVHSTTNNSQPSAAVEFFARRRAGVLLHVTSLPSKHPDHVGDLGSEAHRFLAFLAASGVGVWQMLPIGPTHDDRSPYQTLSTHAGNSDLISLEMLQQQGWLQIGELHGLRADALAAAARRFAKTLTTDAELQRRFTRFCADNAGWLDDFALFIALREVRGNASWLQWEPSLRRRDADALAAARVAHAERLTAIQFEQFIFYEQWQALREEARRLDIALFGDLPIFVAHDSADVWSRQELFALDADGNPLTVAGVPPDYFSETGQRWGNPHYDWARMQADDFAWWRARVRSQLRLFDLLRIDHFRGFEAYWEIPSAEPTAVAGRWVKAPGDALLAAIFREFPQLPLVAEDLGIITPEVEALRERFHLPGMLILQFAFDGSRDNPYIPHHHKPLSVVYTGTHDNDTTLGWFNQIDQDTRDRVLDYLGYPRDAMPRPLLRTAFASVARLAVVPMQDLLEQGTEHRMNIPGTSEGNWRWQFDWSQVPDDLSARVRHWLHIYGRL
ncbi:MAG TPA: 4-alpha-glucanotransferase [Spongiibacteraceae bacterium]|nr:4-alpha-glucanotransferase [Spongiibacteraceae bacterium]